AARLRLGVRRLDDRLHQLVGVDHRRRHQPHPANRDGRARARPAPGAVRRSMTAEVDRDELRTMVRGMLDDVSGSEVVRAAAESESRYDEHLWNQLKDVGWAGIEAPEELGGGGAGFGEAAVVLVELGRHLTL